MLSLDLTTDREAKLRRRDLHDPAASTISFVRTLGFVANVLGVACPSLHVRIDLSGGLAHVPVWPVTSVVGTTLLSGFRPVELLFVSGHHLSHYRAEHYLRVLRPASVALGEVHDAAVDIGAARLTAPEEDSTPLARAILRTLRDEQREALRKVLALRGDPRAA